MHEVGIIQETIEIATSHARTAGAERVHRIAMRVGELSGAVPEALEFAFEVVAIGTMAEGAVLEIERVATLCYCVTCAAEFQPADLLCVCTRCGVPSIDVRRGRELQLTSLEVS